MHRHSHGQNRFRPCQAGAIYLVFERGKGCIMGKDQGWFESDDEYRDRMEREANERTIEDATGSSPSQGWFETEDEYQNRLADEAHESVIEGHTGSAPSMGWLESDDEYRARIEQEANESRIEGLSGESASQGWFETDEEYNTRVRQEANEHEIRSASGENARQGWFEGDYEYRSRINREANEHKVSDSSEGYSRGRSSSSTASGFSSFYGSSLSRIEKTSGFSFSRSHGSNENGLLLTELAGIAAPILVIGAGVVAAIMYVMAVIDAFDVNVLEGIAALLIAWLIIPIFMVGGVVASIGLFLLALIGDGIRKLFG